ncbi:baseplate J/gp47 family protein [Colidextribacter sp. 210702-DFI.3.9]|nr:baseplate J/gp47 family protein [Colidextribacter sp. 210702-DFI.3.9]
MAEFTLPAFLQKHSTDDIHEKMRAILPPDLDMSEGGHAWNMTRPTALVIAELCEFVLPEVIKLIFPEWSYGEFLDGHAKARGITRRPAAYANGEITITGAEKTEIPAGSLFSTAAINDEPSVDYETLETVVIPGSGTVTAAVRCTQAGIIGNATAGAIEIVSSRLTGITGVINTVGITGGTEEESDESLIERIAEYDKSQGDSYTGTPSDYKRWAKSVAGVGDATVISAHDDSGLVTIILTDSNGDPATELLCTTVYNYIMRPDAPEERLAPINAFLKVTPPMTLAIGVQATVELEDDATIESVKADFLAQIALYLPVALSEGEVKYTRVGAILSAIDGVNDFKNLKLGVTGTAYGTGNIAITTNQLPVMDKEDCTLIAGTV